MKTIKVGIIGFGNIGKKRFGALRNLRDPNISILFICEKKKLKLIIKKSKFIKIGEKRLKIK